MKFSTTLVNRLQFPVAYVMVVEDDMMHQKMWMDKLSGIFKPQGEVIVTLVPTADMAYSIIKYRVDRELSCSLPTMLILDHDLQWGNGRELIIGLRSLGVSCPLFLSSGIDANNANMEKLARLSGWSAEITILKNKHNDPDLGDYISRSHRTLKNLGILKDGSYE